MCNWKTGIYRAAACLTAALVMTMAGGCGKGDADETRVVLTTGFDKDEIFRIENSSCTLPEMMVYLTNMQEQYESVFGSEIWQASFDGASLEQNVKDTALARMAQIKTMNLLAKQQEVSLDDGEQEQAVKAAQEYYLTLNDREKELLGVDQELIESLYREYALADKVYRYIIKDINPEISDDEARTITVQQILFKTYALDGDNRKTPYTEATRQAVKEQAELVLAKAREGEDFEELMLEYSEDNKGTYSFGKGEADKTFEDAAFNLGTDEISELVETSEGYHIIKCISTFDREETDANKVKIVEQRKKEVFGQEYDTFVASLSRNLNRELWEKVTFLQDSQVATESFFAIYSKYFPGSL